jgi:hypothetical protein
MSVESLEQVQPRDAGTAEFDEIVAGLFENESNGAVAGPDMCIITCSSGVTFVCDGATGDYTCGWLSIFD